MGLWGRVLAWLKSHQGRKILRYITVSAVTTTVSFASISLLYGLSVISSVIWATVAGNFAAAVPAYYLNRTWTWGKHGPSHLTKEVLPFAAMSSLGIGVSILGATWARHAVHTHHWSHLINTGLVSGTNLASFAVFWVLKMLVFNRIFRVDPLAAIDSHLSAEEHIEESAQE
jgi:putative flippase GtrA